MVVKRNTPALAAMVGHEGAFVADAQGVVILAQDTKRLLLAMPGAAVAAMDPATRESRYRRERLPELRIAPWPGDPDGVLRTIGADPTPQVLVQRHMVFEALDVYVAQPLPEIEALAHVRKLERVKVWSRTAEKLAKFCERMRAKLSLEVVPAASPADAVTGSDIVVTITTSATPVFSGELVVPGMHINAAGSNSLLRQEIDEATVRKCDPIVVDAGFGTPAAAGEMEVRLTVDQTCAGPRTLTVTLADASGAPITDATVQFSARSLDMDMGISQGSAAMTSPGQYSGTVNMGMGGNWQVDVSVTRPGQPTVVVRFTVALTGPG